jgi:hypothetical protein
MGSLAKSRGTGTSSQHPSSSKKTSHFTVQEAASSQTGPHMFPYTELDDIDLQKKRFGDMESQENILKTSPNMA